MNKHANLIYQLKQHARIGMPDPTDEGAADATKKTAVEFEKLKTEASKTTTNMTGLNNATQLVANQMKKLKEALPSLSILMKEIGNVVSKSTGANMGFSRGLGIIIAQQKKYAVGIKQQVKANSAKRKPNYFRKNNGRGRTNGPNMGKDKGPAT